MHILNAGKMGNGMRHDFRPLYILKQYVFAINLVLHNSIYRQRKVYIDDIARQVIQQRDGCKGHQVTPVTKGT